jgi:nicotinamidase-related amidase
VLDPDLDRLSADHYAALGETMRGRGFAGRVGYGERPAVLVVDLIRGFTDPACPLASDLDAEVLATRDVLRAARAAGALVILSTAGYDDDLQDAGVWGRKIPSNEWLTAGSPWVAVDPRLEPDARDHVLVKKYASCFFGTDLVSRLVSRNVDTLIVTGCSTSGCVRASAVDACSSGFRTLVVADAVGDRAPLSHRASLFDIDAKYGDVVASADVIAYLRRIAAAGAGAGGAPA